MVSFNTVFESKVHPSVPAAPLSTEIIPRVARETDKGVLSNIRPGLFMACPWDAYRSSVRPSVRDITRTHARTRSLGSVANRAPGPPPSFFLVRSRLSYISCSTPEFQTRHFTLSFLREPPDFPPWSRCHPSPPPRLVPPLGAHAWDHVSLSINDFYGLPSSSRTFFFFSSFRRTCLLLGEKRKREDKDSV